MPLFSENSDHSRQSQKNGSSRTSSLRLGALLRAGRWLCDADRDDSMMAFWAIEDRGTNELPGPLESASRRMQNRLRRDEVRADNFERTKHRLMELECLPDSEPVLDHFQRVTGHALAELHFECEASAMAPSTDERVPIPQPKRQRAARYQTLSAIGQRVLATIFVVYLTSIGLVREPRSLPDSLMEAQGREFAWVKLGETPRGLDTEWALLVRAHYVAAFNLFRESRTSVLGFFPGYDQGRLQGAIRHLEQAVLLQGKHEPADSGAVLLLSRAYLQLGDVSNAEPLLKLIISRGGSESVEAAAYLASAKDYSAHVRY